MANNYTQDYVCTISPTEFEEYCLNILNGYAEEEKLTNFTITHNVKVPTSDGTYQIDVLAEFTAMGVNFKVLCECKRYSHAVNREKVVILHSKLASIGAQKGILLSTSGFQSGAIEYAEAHGIALIQVFDDVRKHYSYGPDPKQERNIHDYLSGRVILSPYIAVNCTSDTDYPRQIYPTKAMELEQSIKIRKLIKKMIEEENRNKDGLLCQT